MTSLPRLEGLAQLRGAAQRPAYDPASHGVGIVHIGPGAFHRAHQAVITDAALAAGGGDWRIQGVSLRSRDLADALRPQNGLYTVIERDGGPLRGQVIGSVAGVLAQEPAAIMAALVAPEIRVVSLTVTEKGYGMLPGGGGLDIDDRVVAADLANDDTKLAQSVPGLLVSALAQRRKAGLLPFTCLSCDNLSHNGRALRRVVTEFADLRRTDVGRFIADEVAFPSTMVDRITPAPTPRTIEDAGILTGCIDLAAVETEPFLQWVIEDHFPAGRPMWEAGGAVFVSDVSGYEAMKLTMLNGSHSLMAWMGVAAGWPLVRDVMAVPGVRALLGRHMAAAAALLPPLSGLDTNAYAHALLDRFANPGIAHRTAQIATDSSQKLPQRILAPASLALERGADLAPFAFAVAAWMRMCLGEDQAGAEIAISDPLRDRIVAALRPLGQTPGAEAVVAALHLVPGLFPAALVSDPSWQQKVRCALDTILTRGMMAAISEEIQR